MDIRNDNCGFRRSGLLTLLFLLLQSVALADVVSEYAVKAAVAHKITKFVTWPAQTFGADDSPIRFCVAESGPILEALRTLEDHAVHGRPVVMRGLEDPYQVADHCDVLYLSTSSVSDPSVWLQETADRPILTFGETADYGGDQAIVSIAIRHSKVGFDINIGASERAGLTISAQLLQLAAITNGRRR